MQMQANKTIIVNVFLFENFQDQVHGRESPLELKKVVFYPRHKPYWTIC